MHLRTTRVLILVGAAGTIGAATLLAVRINAGERPSLEQADIEATSGGGQPRQPHSPRLWTAPALATPAGVALERNVDKNPDNGSGDDDPNLVNSDDQVDRFVERYALEERDPQWARGTEFMLEEDFLDDGRAAGLFDRTPSIECRHTRCVVSGRLRVDAKADALLGLPYRANCMRTVDSGVFEADEVAIMFDCREWRDTGSVPLNTGPR